MYKIIYFTILIVFCVSTNLFAQDKFEKETRIKPKDVPSNALLFVDSLNLKTKVKWHQEEGLNKKSIEAKFKLNKAKYSVEFDSMGTIEDVEIEVVWSELEPGLRESVSLQLQQNCSSYEVSKVQRQFTGKENDLSHQIKSSSRSDLLKIKYEIIVKCKQQNSVDLFEYLFDDSGEVISTSKIVFKNSSHLEY